MKKLIQSAVILMCMLFAVSLSFGQSISGVVTGTDGEALPGAAVLIKGTTNGVITDLDGAYTIGASDGDVLVISYVGYLQQQLNVSGGQAINVTLSQDATSLSDVVVTATRQPVRKIRTTTAITSIGSEELASIQPESVAEVLTNTPGITVENSQGRKSTYNIRGFPSGNTYVTTLLDGLPLNGFASRSAGTTEFQGLDKNVGSVEVVRGSGATLFGRAAGAGAVNLISRSGGEELQGGVSFTMMNKIVGDDLPTSGGLDRRVDFYLNGPITDNLRFSIGGYNMEDSGMKEWGVKDKGTQVSANLDYLFGESKIRLYGIAGNNQYNNLTDSPYDLGKRELATGWTTANTFYPDNTQLNFDSRLETSVFAPAMFSFPILDNSGNEIIQNQVDANREEVKGNLIGLSADIALGGGLSLVQKMRVSSYDWRDQNEITFSSFYTAASSILRLNANSQGTISDFINETRLQYSIDNGTSKHNLSLGVYLSNASYDRFGGLHWYTANVDPRPTYSWFGPPGTPPPSRFSLSSTTSHQEESVLGLFAGDEMSFNDKLSVNVGVRFDKMTGFFNNDPEDIGDISYDPAELTENELDFSNFSGSLGVNYLLTERSAVYGSIVRAFSLPSVGLSTPLPEKDEIVINTELGYRFGIGDLGVDLALFNTVINNRVASVFDPDPATGQTFVNRPVGKNTVQGLEAQFTYAPSSVKGLLLRGTVTLQSSKYDGLQVAIGTTDDDDDPATPNVPDADIDNLFGLDLVTLDASQNIYAIDVTGNQVQNTPTTILSFNASYNAKFFGLGIDFAHYAGRYATALNLYDTPNLTVANANLFGRYPLSNGSAIKLGVRIKNLLDGADPQQIVIGSTTDDELIQKQATPNYNDVLAFGVLQVPRRILITLGYDF